MRRLSIALGVAAVLAIGLTQTVSASFTSFTVDDRADLSASKTEVTVTGTVVCTAGNNYSVTAYVFQSSGKVDAVAAAFSPDFVCTGTVQSWSVVLPVLVGTTLKQGPATFYAGANDSTDFTSTMPVTGDIHLQR